jgi:hypothetical protein
MDQNAYYGVMRDILVRFAMTKHLSLSMIVAVLALAIAAPNVPAQADDGTRTKVVTVKKKHKRHVAQRVVRQHSAYPELEPYRSFGFIGEFPGSCAYDRAAGRCMIDLGYGRCVSCDQPGGRF